MKKLSLPFFILSVFCINITVSAQDDEPYYNNREAYKENASDTYSLRISTSLSRPFYRDLSINTEFAFYEDFSLLMGFGVYLPRTYPLKIDSFEDKIDILADKPGTRILCRGYSYIGSSLDASYGAVEFAYNSLAGIRFLELGMCFGGVIKLFDQVNIAPEVGFGARKFMKYGQIVSNDNFPVPYVIADVTLGFNF